nr:MAG TPA: hypothetical protein [Caudoviricetes sp.]
MSPLLYLMAILYSRFYTLSSVSPDKIRNIFAR